jgi:hypothetical protein
VSSVVSAGDAWKLSKFRAGDLVEVRSAAEILATLDSKGQLDGLPFMPEMLAFCGRQIQVAAVAHKTCDPAHKTGGRRLSLTVHLEESRCDGSAHGGCEAECNLFWKDAWLKPASGATVSAEVPPAESIAARLQTETSGHYVCQATELIHASTLLPWWNVRQYALDVVSGNHSIGTVARVLLLSWSRQLLRIPVGYRLFSAIDDWMHRLLTGAKAPRVAGSIEAGQKTPSQSLGLVPGEEVRVRPLTEIESTLDGNSKNRGMWFDIEQIGFCESSFAVHRRVNKIIDERSGKMMELKNPCITLKGVYCSGQNSAGRLLCPRAITPYWREVWLKRDASGGAH